MAPVDPQVLSTLSARVETLNSNFELARNQANAAEAAAADATAAVEQGNKLKKWLIALTVGAIIAALGLGIASYVALDRIKDNARASCEFGNARNDAIKDPWTVLVAQSQAGQEHPTPEQLQAFENFRNYLDALYAPRDCDNPGAKFVKPPKPDLSGLQK